MLKTTGAGLGGLTWIATVNNWAIQLFNVPLAVVGMAAAGTLLSFGYGQSNMPRKKLFGYALGIVFLVTVSVAVVPAFMGWEWVTPQREAPLAGLLGAGGRFIVPALIKAVPEIIRKIFRLDAPTNKDTVQDEPEAKS